jgi:D-cysteine desulfhydrase
MDAPKLEDGMERLRGLPHLPRLNLLHAPTPIVKARALDDEIGVDLWIKRDDTTGGAETGNKLRKLELLLADALAQRATVILTCGGIQSNHARATALTCAALGLRCVLFLRVEDARAHGPERAAPREQLGCVGNVLLDRLAGAEIRLISRDDYADRVRVLERAAADLEAMGERPYVIPEGGSNALGALGYVEAMREVRGQLDLGLGGGPAPYDWIVHACGSGGTAAGVALGASRWNVAARVRAVAVCDDAGYFERVTSRIMADARGYDGSLNDPAPLVIDEAARGPGYGIMSDTQRAFVVSVARASGVVLDPVYTGKALFGLSRAVERGDVPKGARVLFIHTGGLPGLLAQGDAFEAAL